MNKRKEISIPILESTEKYIEFLLLIGMNRRDSKSKIRHVFKVGELDVTVNEWDVEELGDRLEIEGEDKSKVKELASKLSQYCEPTPLK